MRDVILAMTASSVATSAGVGSVGAASPTSAQLLVSPSTVVRAIARCFMRAMFTNRGGPRKKVPA